MSRPSIWLFAGQGSQFSGLGKEFDENFRRYRDLFVEGSDHLHKDLRSLALHGSEEELRDTRNTQPVLFCFGLAVARILREETGRRPVAAGGHSLGELTASVDAGVLPWLEGLRLVQVRADCMARAVASETTSMVAILGLPARQLEKLAEATRTETGRVVVCANYNDPGQTVLSGHADAVALTGRKAREAGARRVVSLSVSAPFHSPLMAEAATRFAAGIADISFSDPSCPVWSNTTAKPYAGAKTIADLWVRQLSEPVRFVGQLEDMRHQFEEPEFLEIAPRATLRPMVTRTLTGCPAITISKPKGLQELLG